jgi:integrase
MAKTMERLSALRVTALKSPGYFADGGNLYLRITPSGARGWIFRYAINGRTRDMGLGAFPEISLAAARKLAERFRKLVKEGTDPIEQRRTDRAVQRVVDAKTLTFDECARDYISDHEPTWRSAKHRAQWRNSIKAYASPAFGKLPVAAIDDGLVLRVLKPIWHAKPETASRLRGRIESILDWARVHGYRTGENPARWRGHLKHSLPARGKVRRIKHFAALPYSEIGSFTADLRVRNELASQALQFLILTAARSGEALRATWQEIDLEAATWKIPDERMKAGQKHRVPLSAAAVAILQPLYETRVNIFVFPGARFGWPLCHTALLMLLRRMGRADVTVHGFRATFKTWATERTGFPREVIETALAHAVGNAVEAAYQRGDLFDKRRRLMDAWAEYCAMVEAGASVLPLRAQQR